MDPTWKKRLLDYSAGPTPTGFKSWREFEDRPALTEDGQPRFDANGAPKMVSVEKPRWGTGQTIEWLRRNGWQLAQTACKQGWHMRLMDFVSYRHRLPGDDQIEQLIIEQNKIDRWNLPKSCYVAREQIAAALTKPLKMQAAE